MDGIEAARMVEALSGDARGAARALAGASTAAKDAALRGAAARLRRAEAAILRADSAALCLKTANAVLLKGGTEAQATNRAIAEAFRAEVEAAGLPAAAVQLVEGGREVTRGLLKRDDRIDVVIARGGETLKHTVLEESRIPVVKHFEGICHLYVDESADLAIAERICLNAKVERPSVCNA